MKGSRTNLGFMLN